MRVLSLAARTIIDAGPVRQIHAAADAGFEMVGLRLIPPDSPAPFEPFVTRDRALAASIKETLSSRGVGVLDAEVFAIREGHDATDYEAGIDLTAELGAKFLVSSISHSDEGAATAQFAAFCEVAAKSGLTVCLEFMPFNSIATLGDAVRVLRAVDQPNAAILLDTLHLSRSRGTAEELADVVRQHSAWFPYAQFCDATRPIAGPIPPSELRREARQDRRYPGKGELDLGAVLRALPDEIALSIEAPFAADASLNPSERALNCMAATREFLQREDMRQ